MTWAEPISAMWFPACNSVFSVCPAGLLLLLALAPLPNLADFEHIARAQGCKHTTPAPLLTIVPSFGSVLFSELR